MRRQDRLAGLLAAAALAGATPPGGSPIPSPEMQGEVYRLGAGDKVRITVYNEATLSGDYEVDGAGVLALPLIGAVTVAGRSLADATAAVAARLKDGYLRNPSVAMQVLNYRPFYVLGEVREPGKFPYVSGMTVLAAIALAGGYTYRGKKTHVMATRAGDPTHKERSLKPGDSVMPGDVIRVPERIF